MQLVKLSNKLVPLTLAAGLVSAPFMYADVDAHSGIFTTLNNHRLSEYVSSIDENEVMSIAHKSKFQALLEGWKRNTVLMSSPNDIVNDENFREIVKMGRAAVPSIIEELSAEPSPLVWALNFIYGRKISTNPNTTISQACKLWVKELSK